jgi:hypothetical protein
VGIRALLNLIFLNLVGPTPPIPLHAHHGQQIEGDVTDGVTQGWLPGTLRLRRFRFSHGVSPDEPGENPHKP